MIFKEEGGGGGGSSRTTRVSVPAGRVHQQQEGVVGGVQHVHEEEDRAAVNHRVCTGSVSASRREESTVCLINSKLNPGIFFVHPLGQIWNLSSKKAGFITL